MTGPLKISLKYRTEITSLHIDENNLGVTLEFCYYYYFFLSVHQFLVFVFTLLSKIPNFIFHIYSPSLYLLFLLSRSGIILLSLVLRCQQFLLLSFLCVSFILFCQSLSSFWWCVPLRVKEVDKTMTKMLLKRAQPTAQQLLPRCHHYPSQGTPLTSY